MMGNSETLWANKHGVIWLVHTFPQENFVRATDGCVEIEFASVTGDFMNWLQWKLELEYVGDL